jgi:predicted HD phosphohydrolase
MDDAAIRQSEDRATFRTMQESNAADWQTVLAAGAPFRQAFPDRVLEQMRLLGGDCGGFAVDRLEHSLQTATRAHQAGRDEDYVVCALLHDIGDLMCPSNHADMAASMLKPYVSEQNHWMLEQHTIFQGYYYFHHLGLDRDMREQFRGHPHFEHTAQFCHLYDQNSFDPNFESMPLEAFEPMLRRVLATPRRALFMRAES